MDHNTKSCKGDYCHISSKDNCPLYIITRCADSSNIYELSNIDKYTYYVDKQYITTPNGMEFDKYGNLFVVNQNPPMIVKIDTHTKPSLAGQFPCDSMLKNIDIDLCDNIYVTDCTNKAVYKISDHTEKINKTDIPTPFDLVYDEKEKNVYVTNTSDTLYKIDQDGNVTSHILEKDARYTGIVMNYKRELFILDKGSNPSKIIKIANIDDDLQEYVDFTILGSAKKPTYMSMDKFCNLYVVSLCNKKNKIIKVDKLGFQTIYNSSYDIAHPAGIANVW